MLQASAALHHRLANSTRSERTATLHKETKRINTTNAKAKPAEARGSGRGRVVDKWGRFVLTEEEARAFGGAHGSPQKMRWRPGTRAQNDRPRHKQNDKCRFHNELSSV